MRNDFLKDAYANSDLMTGAVRIDASGVRKKVNVDFIRENSTITVGVVDVQSARPSARGLQEDFDGVTNAWQLVIDDVTYYVADSNLMSHGEVLLELSRDPTT